MRIFLMAAAGVLIAGAANAATVYDCKISSRDSKNVPKQIIVEFDPANGAATAIDEFVNHYVKKPIKARVVKDNDKRLTVSYSLDGVAATNGTTIVNDETRLTIVKASGEALVSYNQGYGITNHGSGTCKIGK